MKPSKAEIISIAMTSLFIIGAAAVTFCGNGFFRGETVIIHNIQGKAAYGNSSDISEALAVTDKININTASAEVLSSLPGIGQALSKQIIAYREANGAFSSAEEIMMVSGIGEEKYKDIRDLIAVQ